MVDENKEYFTKLYVDKDFASYAPIYNDTWAKEQLQLIENPEVRNIFTNFVLSVKSASHCFQMPVMSFKMTSQFFEHFGYNKLSNSAVARFLDYIMANLSERIVLTSADKENTKKVICDLSEEFKSKVTQKHTSSLKVEDLWDGMFKKDEHENVDAGTVEFSIIINEILRTSFISTVFAYEKLLTEIITFNGNEFPRETRKRNKAIREVLGDELTDAVWTNSYIKGVFTARNCIAHHNSASQNSNQLNAASIEILNDNPLIKPANVRHLHETIYSYAEQLIKWCNECKTTSNST